MITRKRVLRLLAALCAGPCVTQLLVALSMTLDSQSQSDVRNFFFETFRSLGDMLDNVPVMITRAERHLRIVA